MCIKTTIGDNVRRYRNANHWSQEALAEACGLNRSYIGAIERADVAIGIGNFEKISKALKVTYLDLLIDPTTAPSTPKPVARRPDKDAPFIHGPTFITMVRQCKDSPDSILGYLERSGVRVVNR